MENKKQIWKKWWFWVIVCIVIILIISGGYKKKETIPEATIDKVVETTEIEKIGTKEVEEKKKEEKPKTLPVKEWKKVIKLTANNSKQSETFYLSGGQQKLFYSVSGDGMCLIYIMKEGTDLMENGGIPVIWQDGNINDETLMRKNKGYYYLDLQLASGSCIVEIQEFK